MPLRPRPTATSLLHVQDVYQGGSLTAITQLFNTTKPQTILELGAHSGETVNSLSGTTDRWQTLLHASHLHASHTLEHAC